jgi:signal transduction histidine kinase
LNGAGLRGLGEEQAALRRVATLVARGVPAGELFRAVTEEVRRVLSTEYAHLIRYGTDDMATVLAAFGRTDDILPAGTQLELGGSNATTLVFETGRSARIDNYGETSGPFAVPARGHEVRSSVATPILVEARLWGVMVVGGSEEQPLPADTEARLADFTELVGTAIANAETAAGLARLADEQAALRRVATLVARGTPPAEVFAAVTEEVRRLLVVELATMVRYEPNGAFTIVGNVGSVGKHWAVGSRWPVGGNNTTTLVFETARPARVKNFDEASGAHIDRAREVGIRSAVGTPIIVEGRLWGGLSVGSTCDVLPPDTEARLSSFTELVATAIANAESRAELTASRARIVAAADESRRRIERDLHDGAQQRLVHTVIVQQLALRALENGDANVGELMAEALRHAEQANYELSELAHGILPSVLTREGLRAGVQALVSRMSLPVSVNISAERFPAGVEATAYFVVSEALTNVVKHARADRAGVTARVDRGVLRIEIYDEGVGGAHVQDSTGLHGLEDRVSALDGHLVVESPLGRGTRVYALLPVPDPG